MKWFIPAATLLAAPIVLAPVAGPAIAEETEAEIQALLEYNDDLMRGSSSHAMMTMHVKTSRYERRMKMEAWSQGESKSLIRILEPAKDAGTATLKSGDNLWNYLPKVDRTMKVPAGMMSGNWMGSHFTNDDLVKDSRLSDDFSWTVTERPSGNSGKWVIELVPHADAAVVWGKVTAEIRHDKMPISTRFYDEDGALVRTMSFDSYETVQGRKVPMHMKMVPADKPGEFTEMTYQSIEFDVKLDSSMFTQQALRQ